MIERRQGKFTERLSTFMCAIAATGAAIVLMDPKLTIVMSGGHSISIGGVGFSADLKGAVIASILISGYTAVKEFWLGSSATGQVQSESIARIAEASAPVAAAAVAAANGIHHAEDVTIAAAGDVEVHGQKDRDA